jgi:hypothetical protein
MLKCIFATINKIQIRFLFAQSAEHGRGASVGSETNTELPIFGKQQGGFYWHSLKQTEEDALAGRIIIACV